MWGLVRPPARQTYLQGLVPEERLLPWEGTYESVERAVRRARPELVYHLATHYTGGHGREETPRMVNANLVLGAYLLEALAQEGGGKLVYATSVMTRAGDGAYRPQNLYAATKQALSDLMDYYTQQGLVQAVTLMLSDTYGPGDRRNKILNLVRKAAQSGSPLALSDGGQEFDLVHVDDVVRAFLLAGELLEKGGFGGTYQVMAENPLSLSRLEPSPGAACLGHPSPGSGGIPPRPASLSPPPGLAHPGAY